MRLKLAAERGRSGRGAATRGVSGRRRRTTGRLLSLEALESRRVLAASYVYGIDDSNNIYQIDPIAKAQSKIFETGLGGTANSNAFAYDRTNASREFLFYMNYQNADTAGNQTLYVWNKMTGVQSVVATAANLANSTHPLSSQPGDAAFYNDRYWYFEQGSNVLHEMVLDYTSGTPVFGSDIAHTIDFSGIAGFNPAADNVFGDIAINRTNGTLYASTTAGYFYSLNTANLSQAPTLIGTTPVGLQLAFNTDYSTLFAQRFVAGDGTGIWYTVSTTDASLTALDWTSANGANPGFRDLAGASPVPAPALDITKSDGVDTVFAGDGVVRNYTITVMNNGQVPATNAVVTDSNWPAGFVQGTVTAPAGTTFTPGVGGNFTWTFTDPLAAGASKTLTVPYTVPFGVAAGTRLNTASVTSTGDPETHESTDATNVVSNALVAGSDLGCQSTPRVYVINPYSASTEVFSSWLAYEPGFRGGVRVAVGDVDGDGVLDVTTAPGPGRPGQVKVFNLDGTPKAGFTQPYAPFGLGYRDGVEIGLGDINGDGKDDLVASKSRGRGDVQVATSDATKFTPYRSFTAFSAPYTGGASAAIAGENRVVVGSGVGMKPTIKTYNVAPAVPTVISQFNPALQPGTAGVSVSTQRFANGTNPLDVLAAAGRNGNSKVSAYRAGTNANLQNYSTFSAPAPAYNTPVYAAGAALAESLVADTVFMAQGDGGKGSIKKVNATTGVVDPAFVPLYNGKPLVSPLRIAANTRPLPVPPP